MTSNLVIIISIFVVIFFILKFFARSAAVDITQNDFINRQSKNDFVLLDVRSAEEFSKGYIKGAININFTDVASHLEQLPKDKDIFIYCRSGRRVSIAANMLAKKGYNRLFHIDGDMLGWERNQHPIIKK